MVISGMARLQGGRPAAVLFPFRYPMLYAFEIQTCLDLLFFYVGGGGGGGGGQPVISCPSGWAVIVSMQLAIQMVGRLKWAGIPRSQRLDQPDLPPSDRLCEFHDQEDAKWIVIEGQLWRQNDTPFGRPIPSRPIGHPGVGRPQGVFGGLSYH
jgi:hypothetical protein